VSKPRATTRELEEKFSDTAFRLSQERSDFLLPQILDFVKKERWINLRPEYQRRSVWDTAKRSLFIESLLLNIPIPPIFLFEKALSRYEVMDGQQRLNAIIDFYENGFALKGLEKWSELNGARFKDLPDLLRRGLDRRRISATVILAETTKELDFGQKDIRKLVFERLNQGGQTLLPQELRNCLYSGCFNDLLSQLAGNPIFTAIWEIPPYHDHVDSKGNADSTLQNNPLYKRMRDCEIVLRFFAFQDTKRIKGSVRAILDQAMEDRLSTTEREAEVLGALYIDVLTACHELFGKRTFLLRNKKGKSELSIPLYDGVMFAMSRHLEDMKTLMANKAAILGRLDALMASEEAYDLMVGRANTSATIRQRLHLLEQVIAG
jgi:hypothetical protein